MGKGRERETWLVVALDLRQMPGGPGGPELFSRKQRDLGGRGRDIREGKRRGVRSSTGSTREAGGPRGKGDLHRRVGRPG